MKLVPQTTLGAVSTLSRRPPASTTEPMWLLAFLWMQIACQLALLSNYVDPFRVLVRVAAFGGSLILLCFLPGKGSTHPSARPALWVVGIVGLALLHPTTNSALSGLAQALMYLAILAPLFWVPRLRIDTSVLYRLLFTLWVFHVVSSGLGILQIYFPGRFQPHLSSVIVAKGENYINQLCITTSSGQRVFRPMGLTDIPGGVATAGFYVVLFGIGFFFVQRRLGARLFCVGCMIVGMVSLYLSQVRSVLVMLAFCLCAFSIWLLRRGEIGRLALLAAVLFTVVLAGFTWADSLGGDSISTRLTSLIDDRPREVYYRNRGIFLEYTVFDLMPRYPLGAGIGRWGMSMAYFGDNSDPERSALWAEIQWTGWLLDGGIPLILVYLIALVEALRTAWNIAALGQRNDLWLWGGLLLAYNLGACVITFNYPFFMSQSGLEFWLLNAAFFAAARHAQTGPLLKKR